MNPGTFLGGCCGGGLRGWYRFLPNITPRSVREPGARSAAILLGMRLN